MSLADPGIGPVWGEIQMSETVPCCSHDSESNSRRREHAKYCTHDNGSGHQGPQDWVVRGSRHHHDQSSLGVVPDFVVCYGLRWVYDEYVHDPCKRDCSRLTVLQMVCSRLMSGRSSFINLTQVPWPCMLLGHKLSRSR
jgi:hypothetical protein